MTTSTFSHAGADRNSSHVIHAVGAFLVAWFQATPVYFLYRALTH